MPLKRMLLIGSIVIGGTGCAAEMAAVKANDWSQIPTMKLCVDYLTLPSINVWQKYREQELARRNENCEKYLELAEQKRQSNKEFWDSFKDNPKPSVTCRTVGNTTRCTED
jgi:hypothetical protein